MCFLPNDFPHRVGSLVPHGRVGHRQSPEHQVPKHRVIGLAALVREVGVADLGQTHPVEAGLVAAEIEITIQLPGLTPDSDAGL